MSVPDGWEWLAACAEVEGEADELRRIAHELFFACLRLQERSEIACYGRELIEARFPDEGEAA